MADDLEMPVIETEGRDPSIEVQVESQEAGESNTSPHSYAFATSRRPDLKPGFVRVYMHTGGNFLQKKIEERIVYKLNRWLITFSHEPFSAMLTLLPVQIIFVLIGILWIILESGSLHGLQSKGYFSVISGAKRTVEFLHHDYLAESNLSCSLELSMQLASRYIIAVASIVTGILANRSQLRGAKMVMPLRL